MPSVSPPSGWVVICVDCRRIKRDDEWTDERHIGLAPGKSTGFCPDCHLIRQRQGI